VAFVALWQWATITANYRGNWTALFCTGALQPHPPLSGSEHIYEFANSRGYDGQFYHYIAHDPFLRSDLKNYVDDLRLRYHRIFVPLLAYGLAFGDQALIDRAYELVFLLSVGLGVYWSCRFVQDSGLAAAWGLLLLAIPAVPVAMDRMVIDGALAALTAGFVYYSRSASRRSASGRSASGRSASWKLFAVLTCAVLTRETGFLLVLAYVAYLALHREFRMAAVFLLSAAPAVAWYVYVQANAAGSSYSPALIPFWFVVRDMGLPWKYPPGTPLAGAVIAADGLALAGAFLAFGLAFLWFARAPSDPLRIAAALFAAMALSLDVPVQFQNVYHFGRYYSPLFVCLSGIAAQTRNPWLLLPLAMMLPRIAIQLTPQALGVIHWIVERS
jgi:hypothetical protein